MKKKTENLIYPQERKIYEHSVYKLAHQHNVERLSMALALCGYYVRVHMEGSTFVVSAFSDRQQEIRLT